jgi:hypothetical protein
MILAVWCTVYMLKSEKNPAAVALGRAGGLARAKTLTAERRKKIALKASKAAARARTKAAELRRARRAQKEK